MSAVTIREIEKKTTSSGKTYWRVQINPGGWASTWDSKIAALCESNKGSELDVTTEKQGNFTNITAASGGHAQSNGSGLLPSRDVLIVKEVALKAAVERFSGVLTGTDADVLATAQIFTAWLMGEEEPPEPESIPF